MEARGRKRTKIVLDADVIIHFESEECFSTLLTIFPEYEYVVLDVVYNELGPSSQRSIDNFEAQLKTIKQIKFDPQGESRRDYFLLKATKGAGESASMIYCRDNHDVLGSSNLKDILEFCNERNITCLTTLDFLHYAFIRKVMTQQECNEFMKNLKSKKHNLPKDITDIAQYICKVVI